MCVFQWNTSQSQAETKIIDKHNPISQNHAQWRIPGTKWWDKCKLIYRDKNHAVADSKCGGREYITKTPENSMFQRLGVECARFISLW